MTELRIATRASELALAQARWAADQLVSIQPGLEIRFVEVTTSGDRDRVTSVATLTEVGAFVRAVQEAVLQGRADLAVHSCKDLPVDGGSGLSSFYPKREAPWDVLCGHDLDSIPDGARVGTGSPRRAAQMRLLRSNLDVADIRGNVGTRLDKMRSGEYDAVLLAEAGLRRIGRTDQIGHRFTLEEMVPAPAQGALAVEVRADGRFTDLVMGIDDRDTRVAVEAERALMANTRAGCRAALGAYAETRKGTVHLTGFVEDEHGPRHAVAEGSSPDAASRSLQAQLGL